MAQASQPSSEQAYTNPGNPVSKNPTESDAPGSHDIPAKDVIESRDAGDIKTGFEGGNPTPLAHGTRGSGPGEDAMESTEDIDVENVKTDQPPAEGRVYDAVTADVKPGASGLEPSLTANLDQKKAEQKEKREAIKASRAEGADLGGREGQTGGPAVPVS